MRLVKGRGWKSEDISISNWLKDDLTCLLAEILTKRLPKVTWNLENISLKYWSFCLENANQSHKEISLLTC